MGDTPSKVISVSVVSTIPGKYWAYDDGQNDPWWEGGTNPKPYTWKVSALVTQQSHGSHLTREPFTYNGIDVQVGNWIASANTGAALKIISIISKNDNSLVMECEDVDRYNTFQNNLGDSGIPLGLGVIFEIDDNDMPVLNPLPSSITQINFITNINSRFQLSNPMYSYRFVYEGHPFVLNQTLYVNKNTGLFEVADSPEKSANMVGTVEKVYPDAFYLRPITRIIEGINPILPGVAGDIIYVDGAGGLSAVGDSTVKKAYIQLTNSTPDILLGTANNPVGVIGSVMKLNGHSITLTGTTLASFVNNINAATNIHDVTAVNVVAATTAETNPVNRYYGLVGAMGDVISATINGVSVLFDITSHGQSIYNLTVADAIDMAASINAANIPNIVASEVSGSLSIVNTAGGSITIVNGTNDSGGVPFAGASSATGLPLLVSAGTNHVLKLVNNKGHGIQTVDVIGSTTINFGIYSVNNGVVPLGVIVEDTPENTTVVVPNIAARNALTNVNGRTVYVVDSDDGSGNKAGEWSMWIGYNNAWLKTSDQDSASVDARTLSGVVTYSAVAPVLLGEISSGTRITLITVTVDAAFNGISPTLNILSGVNVVMDDTLIDLESAGQYIITSDDMTVSDTEIYADLSSNGSSVGQVTISISYQ